MIILLDRNLGKLARWLRMIGYDARIIENEEEIEEYRGKSGILFVTKNSKLYEKFNERFETVYLPYDHVETQLFYLYRIGKIDKTEDFLKRCPICNVELEPVEKEKVKNLVPPFVYNSHNEFSQCPKCKKAYWKATHIQHFEEKLKNIFKKNRILNIGVTAGDPNGIGPQLVYKLYLQRKDLFRQKRIFIIGSYEIFEFYQKYYHSYSRKLEKVKLKKLSNTRDYFPGFLNIIDVGLRKKEKIHPGKITESGGSVTYRILEKSRTLYLNGNIDIIINLPNSKEALNLAGHHLSGATEFYSDNREPLMTFFSEEMILALLTRHIPIREVSQHITKEKIINGLQILSPYGKIGVIGLNPHASENGLIGDEEEKIIIPAVNEAKKQGINVIGPLIPDTFFLSEKCDVYLSMYHDQLLSMFKKLYFYKSFQASLGITIKRMSVSHGTAWDKVENYSGNPSSLEFILDKGLDLVKWS